MKRRGGANRHLRDALSTRADVCWSDQMATLTCCSWSRSASGNPTAENQCGQIWISRDLLVDGPRPLVGRMRSSAGNRPKCRVAAGTQSKVVHGDASQGIHIIVQASFVAVVHGDCGPRESDPVVAVRRHLLEVRRLRDAEMCRNLADTVRMHSNHRGCSWRGHSQAISSGSRSPRPAAPPTRHSCQ